jgi:threonine aldolase
VDVIDLRSDTVTLPTQQMREAMYNAELGDDVHQDDPTIKRLERMAAEKLGKEDALFVASGTMGNLVAVLTHCEEGDRVVVGSESHIHHYEGDGIQRLVDVVFDPLPNDAEGQINAAALDEELWEGSTPSPTLVCLENTHMRCGGVPITAEYTSSVADVAHERATPLHLDGARIFAAVALGRRRGGACGSVVPVCSTSKNIALKLRLCGTGEFIVRARQSRLGRRRHATVGRAGGGRIIAGNDDRPLGRRPH